MVTFTEQYKNICGFVRIWWRKERLLRFRDELVDNSMDSEGGLMGMQERVDCDDNWGEEGSHHRCRPGESVVCDDEGEAGGEVQ